MRVDLLLHLLVLFLRVVHLLLVPSRRSILLRSKHVHGWGAQEDRTEMAHILRLSAHVLRNAQHDPVRHDLILLTIVRHHHVLLVLLLGLSELGLGRRGLVHHIVRPQHVHGLDPGNAYNVVPVLV